MIELVQLQNSTLPSQTIVQSTAGTSLLLDKGTSFCMVEDITVNTPSAKTFVAGVLEVTTVTFATKAGSTAGDYVVLYDTTGAQWAAALNKSGSDPAPTGATWAAIPVGNKVNVNISGVTTAAQVAGLVITAMNGLTGFTSVITLAATMTATQTVRGPISAAIVKNADDSGSGSITASESTPGVASTVNTTASTITIANHGLLTGLVGQLTTSAGSLPAGLSTATPYYVIPVDANTIQLASTLAHANSGTAISITDQGTATATFTFTPTALAGGSFKLQGSIDNSNWFDITSPAAQSITATGNIGWSISDFSWLYIRSYHTLTAGQMTVSSQYLVRGYSI